MRDTGLVLWHYGYISPSGTFSNSSPTELSSHTQWWPSEPFLLLAPGLVLVKTPMPGQSSRTVSFSTLCTWNSLDLRFLPSVSSVLFSAFLLPILYLCHLPDFSCLQYNLSTWPSLLHFLAQGHQVWNTWLNPHSQLHWGINFIVADFFEVASVVN